MKISDRIYYVGVNDVIKELFEGLWPLPFGVSYNSYLVVDDKVALVDTVEAGFEDEFLEEIEASIGDRPIDYLIVNHMEPDHSSLTAYMLEKYPSMKIVANAKTLPMLKGYYGVSEDRVHVVGEAQTLSKNVITITDDGLIIKKEYAPGSRKAHMVKEAICSAEAYRKLCTKIIDCIAFADRLDGYCDDASEELTICHQYGRMQKMDRGLGNENCNIGDVVNTFLLEYFQSSPC